MKTKKCKCGKILGDIRSTYCLSCSKKGANNPMYGKVGELSPTWNGGRGKMKNGYMVMVWILLKEPTETI